MIYSNELPVVSMNGDVVQLDFRSRKADGAVEVVATIALSRHATTGLAMRLQSAIRLLYETAEISALPKRKPSRSRRTASRKDS